VRRDGAELEPAGGPARSSPPIRPLTEETIGAALDRACDPPRPPSQLRGLGAAIAVLGVVLAIAWLGAPAPPPPPAFAAFIDPSSATAAELTLLPGIGPVLAERIVDHRENHGPFERPEALLAVPGIGPVTLRAIEPWLVIDPVGAAGSDESEEADRWPIR
jgi:competence ComEA-like helix-hairpin-helix protein